MRIPSILLILSVAAGASAQTVFDIAQARVLPPGAPNASDVILRSLRLHPAGANDPHDTLQALRGFHATRLEWTYIDRAEFIHEVIGSGRLFGGAVAAPSYVHDRTDPDWLAKVVIVNLDGEPIMAPWKRAWGPTLWGCINNPELERGHIEYLKRYIDAGAQVMQRDEPGANLLATRWGGCFCNHCMAAFRNWLVETCDGEALNAMGVADPATFDYREHLKQANAPIGDAFGSWKGGDLKDRFVQFQEEATIAFHRRVRAALDAHAGRHVPMSANNGARHWDAIQMEFDWAFGELSYGNATAVQLLGIFRDAANHGRAQVVTMPKAADWQQRPDLVLRTRQTIAMAYACGGHCKAPWDTYMPGDSPRYFGTPEQYADLYGFVRACAQYLNGYEEAAAVGASIPEDRYGETLPVAITPPDACCAVVRAIPGRADRPVAVHIVDWTGSPAPVAVRLDAERFYPGKSINVILLTPVPFDAEAHEDAEATRDFAGLAQHVPLTMDNTGQIHVPALAPWGILMVQPQ